MSGILDSVNQRTQLVGQNRLELLLFRLNGRQRFGINVFKVREVLQCPPLTAMPKLNPLVRGVAHIRGQTISVIDLSMATRGRRIEDLSNAFIVIAEYNRSVQGFLVGAVERIINTNWDAIMPPPQGTGRASYLTAVTEVENELIEILDVEKILNEISPLNAEVSTEVAEGLTTEGQENKIIFIADDSSVARNQVKKALTSLGLEIELAKNGLEALKRLKEIAEEYGDVTNRVGVLVSDIEMPEMDGYTLTAEIKNTPELQKLHVVLHTSLSGVFNQAMVQKVGADDFIAKFHPDELATAVQKWLMTECE
ncbi:chemotaxis protein CheV [Alteromonas mediterranea]|jgi:two-component system, chemotaxis family, chemotaxis protein CheV|uniref:Chemotaxis protein CheW n=3 Tax=Alteromonas mediterranea TaxID=314275 RepID=A0AAC9ACQ3_9ALTE|nr:chemotaxis protein CheV [Alteromonas mediterranea]AGP77279.1 chemotaxis protein [Alteromonas mediterranea 615]MBR9783161.1 chemotaxis protein CheV [Gammaproteobacteria bacterium]MDY6883796.1 chemotaxis protein CheV [Pseudomonadota bacterium]AEA97281.2 chemotaxis protein CheW [Alteromonas mediterranea DE]AFV84527.1 chemotaxis protein [Alteromonas mediterranea DE1]|tara:strand:- start:1012 stop:1941 length:930 start_codon:yes stop_codon:yes gene_type:complete